MVILWRTVAGFAFEVVSMVKSDVVAAGIDAKP
jgi:hypothetical protein